MVRPLHAGSVMVSAAFSTVTLAYLGRFLYALLCAFDKPKPAVGALAYAVHDIYGDLILGFNDLLTCRLVPEPSATRTCDTKRHVHTSR